MYWLSKWDMAQSTTVVAAHLDAEFSPKLCFLQGDSGGPLLYNGIVVGITSNGGTKCGQLKKPGIYTIISHYTEWIDNTMAVQPTATLDAAR